MDALLIEPPWVAKNGNISKDMGGSWPPLGLLYVASFAESKGYRVHLMDAIAEKLTFEDIESFINEHRPPFIGITSVTQQIGSASRVAAIAKRASPHSTVVIGGPHAGVVPDDVLKDTNVDFVIRGEGEYSFSELLAGKPIDTINGLSYRSEGNSVHNTPSEPIMDLDSLPMPAYHLTKLELYRPAAASYQRLPAIAMITTRGCPGKCIFCASAGTKLRTRSADKIVSEIEHLQKEYGIREVNFYDDTFTMFRKNVARFCDLIVERGIDLTWSCFARVDCVNESLLAKMRAAGCHQILYGIESADPEILKNIRKPIDLEQTRKVVRLTQAAGIGVRTTFIFGNPGETVESMRRTIDFAKELEPDIVMFNILVPLPGTEIHKWAKEKGYLRTRNWQDYDAANVMVELPTVASDEINRMYRTAHREFYFRPRYLLRRLMKLRSLEDIKMSIRAFCSLLAVRSTRDASQSEQARRPRKCKPATPAA